MFKSILQACLILGLCAACAKRTPTERTRSTAAPAGTTEPAGPGTPTAPTAPPAGTPVIAAETPDDALANAVGIAIAELASDFQIKFSAGRFISYPMFVSYRIYSAEQRTVIYQHLVTIRDASERRLKNVELGEYALDRTTQAQIFYDLRHIRHLISWLKTYERSLENP